MYSPRRHSPLKIRKFKNYDERNVRLAVQAHSLGMPIRKAATLYGVPKSTVSDRITGRVLHGEVPFRTGGKRASKIFNWVFQDWICKKPKRSTYVDSINPCPQEGSYNGRSKHILWLVGFF